MACRPLFDGIYTAYLKAGDRLKPNGIIFIIMQYNIGVTASRYQGHTILLIF